LIWNLTTSIQLTHQCVEMFVVLHSESICIYNSPQNNEEDEETTNRRNPSHIQHLVLLVRDKHAKYSKEEKCKNPCPDKLGIHVQTRTFTRLACVEHAQENQNKDHNIQNSDKPHFSFR